jgi:photosystem I P700 chlorophyll a apoprotein A1
MSKFPSLFVATSINKFSSVSMIFSYINRTCLVAKRCFTCSRVWSKVGHFSKALSKGPKTTTWIFNLHADAHDFHILKGPHIFSSNLAHLSLVFFWITGMHFHGAYFSNYDICLKDPKHYLPTAHLVWSLLQDILNSDISQLISGIRITSGIALLQDIHITSGIFQLWRSEGIITQIHLKYACSASLIGTIISLAASYFHMHISSFSTSSFYKKFKSLSYHHLSLLFGLSSISWSAHQIHISLPPNRLLDSGIDPVVIPCPQDFLFKDLIEIILPGFSIRPLVNFSCYLAQAKGVSILGCTGKLLNSSTRGVFLAQVTAHHFYIGIVFITSSVIGFLNGSKIGFNYRSH